MRAFAYALMAVVTMVSVGYATDGYTSEKKAVFTDGTAAVDKVVAEETEAVKTADIELVLKTEPVVRVSAPIYSYKGRDHLDEAFQEKFFYAWWDMGLPLEWYPYMIGLIYQECSFNRWSVNRNPDGSEDIGYFQYNSKWYYSSNAKYGKDDAHINSPDDQIWLFVRQMKTRYDKGLSMEECISCHRRGDYDGYDAEYVGFVKQRTAHIVRER